MTTFEDILAPVSLEDFVRDSYGQKPHLINGDADKFAGLFAWDQLNMLLNADVLKPPRVQLISEREPVDKDQYMRLGHDFMSLNSAGLTEQLRGGAVMLIHALHQLFPQLGELTDSLSVFTRAGSQINFYCGWQASKGFKTHWDKHDVWVLQVEGKKSWQIWEPTRLHPLPDAVGVPEPTGDPDQVVTITQGDLLYVPRGWWHRAEALDGVSVHLTLGSRAPTGSDFVRSVAAQLRDKPEWGATLGSKSDELAGEELAARTSADGLASFLDNEAARVWTRPNFELPHAVTGAKPDIGGSTLVKLAWTHGLRFSSGGAGTVRATTVDVHSECDEALQPYLARLSGLRWQTIDEIAAGIDDRKLRRKLLFFITTLEMKSAVLTKEGS